MLEARVLGADAFSRVQGSPAKLQGVLSIPLRTANPVTAKFQIITSMNVKTIFSASHFTWT